METTPYSSLSKGTLLIASPDIDSGIYFRAVILVCEHSASGSFGIIINKPLEVELPEDVINLKEVINPNVQVRAGGPLQANQMMLVHSSDRISEQTLKVCENVFLGGDVQFLQETVADPNGPQLRLCFGYSGWGPGQLEQEFLSGLWFLAPGSAEYLFNKTPEKIWQMVLRQMGGKYATLSMIPEDLSLN